MSFRSCTSSFRRSLALGALACALAWGVVDSAGLPRVAFYGGRKLADKFAHLEALERDGPVDVLVIGPSYIDQGFDAERFGQVAGVRAYNFGVQGTDMYLQSILLRQMLLLGRTPKAVLWGLRDEVLTRSNIDRQYLGSSAVNYATGPGGSVAYSLARHLPQFQRRRMMDWARELSMGVRHWSWDTSRGEKRVELRDWMEPLDAFGRTQLMTLQRMQRVAAHEREDAGDDEEDVAPAASGTGTRFMSQDYSTDIDAAKAHVAETLRLLRARGVKVWLFLTPYYELVLARNSKYSEQILTGANQAYFDWLAGLSAEFDAPLVDLHYCAEISGEPHYFFDTRHLNGPGAAPLGALMGELYAGKRPIPAAWSGVPAPAELEHMLGSFERERVPRLELGARHTLDRTLLVERGGVRLDAYAAFRVERAGTYRVLLSGAQTTPEPPLFVRLGGAHYARWNPPAEPKPVAGVLETRLEPGEHLLELHSANPKQALGWDELLVEEKRE